MRHQALAVEARPDARLQLLRILHGGSLRHAGLWHNPALDARPLSTLERSVDIAAPIAEVFAFHLDTRNAARIAPPGQRVVSVEGAFPLRLGSSVRLRVRQLPLPRAQTWIVRVVALEEPTLVVDELERGPFPVWRHEHRFAALPDGGTRLTDHVEYRLPGGVLGRLADAAAVHRILLATFRMRQARTRALLEARADDRLRAADA